MPVNNIYWAPHTAWKVSDSALDMMGIKGRGLYDDEVTYKLLGAALITFAEDARNRDPSTGRHAALAITAIEQAIVWLEKIDTTFERDA